MVVGPVIPGCLGSDSDFDGFPCHADWPNGSAAFPAPNLISSPHSLSRSGADTATYPVARFETGPPRIEEAGNGGGLEGNHHTGAGCTNPPPGASPSCRVRAVLLGGTPRVGAGRMAGGVS